MKSRIIILAAGMALILASNASAQAGKTNSLTATVNLIGRGITAIGPSSCTFVGGSGSANTPVCQLSATTIPSGQAVTWALTGGTDAGKFVVTSGGAIAVGSADIGVGNYTIAVTASAP